MKHMVLTSGAVGNVGQLLQEKLPTAFIKYQHSHDVTSSSRRERLVHVLTVLIVPMLTEPRLFRKSVIEISVRLQLHEKQNPFLAQSPPPRRKPPPHWTDFYGSSSKDRTSAEEL
ncbi:hypothetical protein F2P81_012475 [Scophthalmus maximus]|uniref:Uncharacterized protein n=1 Tax=Scophthalmus maximus TaxID=52904 RepID=A0A6A4SND2_SCOMX|nr:hypothetical protein F2P81_012475 [Scophthalmus maximus]